MPLLAYIYQKLAALFVILLETAQVAAESMKAFATLRASLSPSGRFTSRIQASTQRRAACRRRCELLGGHSSPRQHSQNQTTDNEKFTKRSRSTPPVCSQRARSIIRELQKLVQAEPLPCGSPGMLCDDLCQNRRMDYWCDDDNCSAGASCTNKCIDDGQSYYETYYTMHKGQGLRSILLIPPNTFLGEYEGKYITREQALRQCRRYAEYKHHYMVDVGYDLVCDATEAHSLIRQVSHSCEPNCILKVQFGSGGPRVGLLSADEPIQPQSELTFNYNFQLFPGKCAQRCMCGTDKCRGYIVTPASNAARKKILSRDAEQDQKQNREFPFQRDGSLSDPIVID